ncbi:anti-sigma factor domain-containing protein [Halococcoides cellulosivorans]|uniref:Anti-sigma K factor RskA C-terminal domain-containing protein n=1 Tax=Halococcoides cellulosivorans TaxID=1679096 RepID=A0A2R4X373_9EURY|nr:anti-sigma factor [Halococcoides cellulosivorans]AWB28251.1 hypothetical protein HARCEL1_11335 [Halococcoides cellulosivorans]
MTEPHTADDDAQRRRTTRRGFLGSAGALVATAGLGGTAVTASAATGAMNAVAYDLSMLPALDQGHYEGWAIFDGGSEKLSTGTFSAGEEYVFEVDRDLSEAEKIVVTIEPDEDPSPDPSGVVVLAGSLSDGTADLSFPVSFEDASGSYILATPTNGGDSNERSGIWFLDPSGPSASLDLPDLSGANWTYEGWVVHGGMPLSTGRFDHPAMADDAAPYSGDQDGPPFPGEDFLQNAPSEMAFPTDLADGSSKAVISVEPDIDGTDPTGPAPFQVKPLAGPIPGDATDHTSYDLDVPDPKAPSGMATLYEDAAAARGTSDGMNAVAYDLSMLPELDQGHYEGWAIFDGGATKLSTGTFSKGEEYVFEVDRDLSEAEKIVVTIEPDEDPSPDPSGVVVLAGSLSDGTADLSFPVSFEDASGSYILATPTNGGDSNERSGIWFLDPSGPSASLDLPDLSEANWTYEGWVVHGGMPLSTGRFDHPAMADDSAPYSGDQDGPPFPGEDFLWGAPEGLEFPTDLADGSSKAVISVEPDIDGTDPTGPAPFQVKPLAAPIPGDATDHTSYDLNAPDPKTPDGTATLYADAAAARAPETSTLSLDLSMLPELSEGHYEGWAIFDGGSEKLSTGTFSAAGSTVFEVDRDLSAAEKIVVTIEPSDDPSPDPSGVVVLAGALEDGIADLSFPVNFEDASGSYILATPTNGGDSNERSGIWFLDPAGGPSASLDLPDLSEANWTYEGWVVHGGMPLSTGRFDHPAMADDAAPYSGDQGAPPFPGEDFLQNAPDGLEFPTDLADGSSKAVISVEPDIDGTDPTGPAPFQVKPLAGPIPGDATDHTSYELGVPDPKTPSGTARVRTGDLDPVADTVPQDIDGDGLHEDLNGNGRLDFVDVNTFYQHSDEAVLSDHETAYDFSEDGTVDMQDVMALFEMV